MSTDFERALSEGYGFNTILRAVFGILTGRGRR
jgi:hypothetical protein